jgi:hypothetical protein
MYFSLMKRVSSPKRKRSNRDQTFCAFPVTAAQARSALGVHLIPHQLVQACTLPVKSQTAFESV